MQICMASGHGSVPWPIKINLKNTALALSGFAARTRTECYGHEQQVTVTKVCPTLMATGQKIALETGCNTTHINRTSFQLLLLLQLMLEGWCNKDSPTMNMLPVEVQPSYLAWILLSNNVGLETSQASLSIIWSELENALPGAPTTMKGRKQVNSIWVISPSSSKTCGDSSNNSQGMYSQAASWPWIVWEEWLEECLHPTWAQWTWHPLPSRCPGQSILWLLEVC